MAQDTIFALSSGALPAGVAVLRVSGPLVPVLLQVMIGRLPYPRHATLAKVRGQDGVELDRGVILFFPAPHSLTGEDVAELQLHGGRATVVAVLADLGQRPGFRMAEAGEFTRRAFLNGRMDLTEVEAFSDLIAAETESQRQFALSNSGGSQRGLYESWRTRLVRARAMIEADLDFSDEEDVPGSVADAVWAEAATLAQEIGNHVNGYRRGEIMRSGYDVVIVGAPNVGKSSLLNALANRDVAIVSDEAGTTRDLIEVALDLNGIKVRITDTAGLREGAGKVETIGIDRARARAAQADMVLVLSDSGDWGAWPDEAGTIRVTSKSDLSQRDSPADLAVSALDGRGLDELVSFLATSARKAAGSTADILPSRERHLTLLRLCQRELLEVAEESGMGLELRAEGLRRAGDALGRLTGRIDVDDMLDAIFAEFCIGK